ncbi:MAG: hypothetical protein WBL84_20925, partial [Xanthobacteraceae bacterium]
WASFDHGSDSTAGRTRNRAFAAIAYVGQVCVQASLDPAATSLNARAALLDVVRTFRCDCFSLQHRRLALLREVFDVRLHAFANLSTARSEFTAMSFDIGGACLHR